jgi:hypothetical protein
MAAFNQLTAAARRLFDKVGGHERFEVDAFDSFLIDEKLVDDPDTSDTTSPVYKGFVQQRGVMKGRLDRAARALPNGEAYRIAVVKAGSVWQLTPLADAMDDDYERFAEKAAGHVENSLKRLNRIEKQMRAKLLDDYDPRLQQVMRINGMMQAEAIGFTSQVKGIAARYDEAYARANNIISQLAKEADVLLIEDDENSSSE